MKKVIVLSAILAVIFASCNASKTTTTTTTTTTKKVDDVAIPVSSSPSSEEMELEGTWELISVINSDSIPFKTMYPTVKPTIAFDARPKQVSGTTGCNSYTGSYSLDGKTLSFGNGMAMTKMACQGNGEAFFVDRLTKTNKFFVKDQKTLMLLDGDIALLEFKKIMGPKSY